MSTDMSLSATTTVSEEEWRRLNPRMLLIHPVKEIGRAFPALIAVFFAGSGSGNGELWGVAGAGIVIILSVSRWFTTRYRVGADQVQIREGLLRRRTLAARLDRVRSIDVTSHFLHRALGLARVEIGTGVSDRKGKSSLRLDGLTAEEAVRLRAELLHHSSAVAGTAPPASRPDQGEAVAVGVAYEPRTHEVEIARFDPSWLKFAPFTLSGAFTGLVIAGFGWRIVSEGHVDLEQFGPLHSVVRQLDRVSLGVAVAEVMVAAVIFLLVASTVGYLLAFWNFRLTRHEGGTFHVTRGLLTTRATSIEVKRLRGVGISESLPLRLIAGARTVAIATGLTVGRGASASLRSGTVLLPDAPLAEARRVASEVVGRPGLVDAALIGHGGVAVRRRYSRAVAAAVVLGALVGLVWWMAGAGVWGWLAVLVVPVLAVPLATDRAHNLGHLVRDGFLVTQSGSLTRRRAILEADAIIGWNVHQSFFQRRVGVANLVATTAAGRQAYRLQDLPAGEVRAVADACLPGLLREFGRTRR